MTIRSQSVAFLSVLLPLCAQQAPAPAAELDKLEPFVGTWEGSGTARMMDGKQPAKWTCRSTYAFGHGGHFLREDSHIEFAGGMPPLGFRSFRGFDRETKRFLVASAASNGEVMLAEMTFDADGSVLELTRKVRDGKPYVERGRTRFLADGSMTFTMEVLEGTGPAQEVVTGTFHRVDKDKPQALDATAAVGEPHPQMQALARMVGEYDVSGTVTMMPGAPAMKINGVQSLSPAFGGTVLALHTEGTAEGMPGTYVEDAFFGWNPASGGYRLVVVNSMGEISECDSRLDQDGKHLITIVHGTQGGTPMTMRGVMELDGSGRLVSEVAHELVGTAPPFEAFRASYKPKTR
jgi:hypothetical protein